MALTQFHTLRLVKSQTTLNSEKRLRKDWQTVKQEKETQVFLAN